MTFLLFHLIFPPVGLIAGLLFLALANARRDRRLGLILPALAVPIDARSWNGASMMNDMIDQCADDSVRQLIVLALRGTWPFRMHRSKEANRGMAMDQALMGRRTS